MPLSADIKLMGNSTIVRKHCNDDCTAVFTLIVLQSLEVDKPYSMQSNHTTCNTDLSLATVYGYHSYGDRYLFIHMYIAM